MNALRQMVANVSMDVTGMAGQTGMCWDGDKVRAATNRPTPQMASPTLRHFSKPNSANCQYCLLLMSHPRFQATDSAVTHEMQNKQQNHD